jgi:hypothetical protein
MKTDIQTTDADLAAAFTEWERLYREEPEQFQSDVERLTATAHTLGKLQAHYLVQILNELKK